MKRVVGGEHLQRLAMKDFFRRSFSFGPGDQELIQRLIEEMYRNRRRIDVQGLCGYYAAVSTFEGRVLLLRLLFQIARADAAGVTGAEEDLILRIAVSLGLGEQVFRQVRAQFMRDSSRAWEILGIATGSSIDEIKAAYRRLVTQWHPDRLECRTDEARQFATERMAAINEAYHLLRSSLL